MATEFTITNRTINSPVDSDIIVQGETNSRIFRFTMQRFFDAVDLTKKTIKVAYLNAKGETDGDPVTLDTVAENTFSFTWSLHGGVTIKSGTVSIWVEISSTNYLWKTKPTTFTIEPAMNIIGNASAVNYSLQKNFYTSADTDENVIAADTSESIYISGRDILMTPLNEFVVCGDNRSQILSFSMDRYFQNVDRSTKKIAIAFVNAKNHSDRAGVVNRVVTDTTITFGWLIDSKVTEKAGIVNFYIEVLGYDENNKFTCWKTLGAQFTVEDGLSVNENIEEPAPSWIQAWELEKEQLIKSIGSGTGTPNTFAPTFTVDENMNLIMTNDSTQSSNITFSIVDGYLIQEVV